MQKKLAAEFLGTLWLVLGGCGTAILAGSEVGWLGVSLAFGLTVVTMAYAIGHISGCHLNPAVTIGLAAAGRHPKSEVAGYVGAQVLGAIAAMGVLVLMVTGGDVASLKFDRWSEAALNNGAGATNGYGDGSPKEFGLMAALVTEVVMTCFFLLVILGATSRLATPGQAGLAIGLCLVLIHLISIPVTNTSVNPARSTGPALMQGLETVKQLWLFWVAPIGGALLAALIHTKLLERGDAEAEA